MRGVVIFRKCQPWDKIVKNEKRICNRGSTMLLLSTTGITVYYQTDSTLVAAPLLGVRRRGETSYRSHLGPIPTDSTTQRMESDLQPCL